ncbi:MAG: hypothetical protein ACKO5C_06745 [Ferruginibacter sp.]
MSFDNFQLSTQMLPFFYKETLVVLDAHQVTDNRLNTPNEPYSGQFLKKTAVWAMPKQGASLQPSEHDQLHRILQACDHTLQDIALFTFSDLTTAEGIEQILQQLPAERLLVFVDTEKNKLPIQPMKKGPTAVLVCYSLQTLIQQPDLKKQLWPQPLKSFFAIP